jgi:flavin-dependent dehydrogenase
MDTDILIIGGGPAGLSTALHLQQLAPELTPRILVLEKERYPRPKLCGGGLVADAELLLQRLGLDVSEVPHVDAEAARFDFAGKGLTVRLPKTHTLRIIRRDEFDAWLAAKARARGIEIREGVTVKMVLPDSTGVTVETTGGSYRAQVVVGADGSNGIVRRCVLPGAPINTARLLEVITPNPHPALPQIPRISAEFGAVSPRALRGGGRRPEGVGAKVAFFDFFPVPSGIAGYTWDFPTQVSGQPRRCWGIYDANLWADSQRPPLKSLLAAEMARAGLDLGEYELKAHPIRWFDPFLHMSVPRVLLVGDAIGADALFGEGISMALGYGKVAAGELVKAFRENQFDLTGYRQRVLLSPLGQTLTARWVLASLIYSLKWTWFQILLWRIFKPVVLLVAWLLVLNWARRMR